MDKFSYTNIKPTPEDSKFSDWSEWSKCEKTCGRDSRVRFREVIPQLHNGKNLHTYVTDADLIQTEDCNKFCRSDDEVLLKWKDYTKCPKSVLPDITKEKMLTDYDEQNNLAEFENPFHIDNLKLVDDTTLLNIFNQWKPASFQIFSSSCYGNEFINGATMFIGSKIYSKNGASYIEYGLFGYFSLFNLNEAGEYISAYTLRKTPIQTNIGAYVKIVGNKLSFYNSSNGIIESITLFGEEPKIIVSENNLIFVETKSTSTSVNSVIGLIGNTPSEYNLTNGSLRFNSDPLNEYKILSSPDGLNYLSIHKSGVKLVNNQTIIWELKEKINCYIEMSSIGFYVKNSGGGIEFKIETNGMDIISLYGINVEMFDISGYMISYWGTKMGVLTENYIIRRPKTTDEETNSNIISVGESGKTGMLSFQKDGNLVYSINNIVVWASDTSNIVSTHLLLKNGELVIMNNLSIVWKSNSSITTGSVFTILIVLEEWMLLTVKFSESTTNTALNILRIYPNTRNIESDSMKNIVGNHIDSNYSKLPIFSIKSKDHKNTTTAKLTKNMINMTDYLKAIKYSDCSALDLFCNLTKTESVNPIKYSVKILTKSTEWKSVNAISTTNFSVINPSLDYNLANTYLYNNNNIIGYKNLYEDDEIGNYSSPSITVSTPFSEINCVILVKKDSSELIDDFISNKEYLETILNDNVLSSNAVASLLGLVAGGDMRLHESFTIKKTEGPVIVKSGFANEKTINDEIIELRLDALENNCSGVSILSKDCIEEISKIRNNKYISAFSLERANKFYKLNMELECRKDFNNISCADYIVQTNGDGSVASFINTYCGKVNNVLSKDCFKACASSISSVMNVCAKKSNIYIFVLFLIYIVMFSYFRISKYFRKSISNTNNIKSI